MELGMQLSWSAHLPCRKPNSVCAALTAVTVTQACNPSS